MSETERVPVRRSLSTKIVGVLVGFLAVALVMIGTTLYLSWQLQGSAAAINETGKLRMASYRLSLELARSARGERVEAADEARHQLDALGTAIWQLRKGDPQRPLVLPPAQPIHAQFSRVSAYWNDAVRPAALSVLAAAPGSQSMQALVHCEALIDGFVRDVDALVRAIETDSERRMFWLRASQMALLAMAVASTVTLVYVLFGLIVAPVMRIHQGIMRMSGEDFSVRVAVDSDDEFGQVAHGFNQMAARLQSLYGDLEGLVRSKTAALEAQNGELALLYDSAAFLQQRLPVDAMCEGFLARLMEYFKADGGSVRVLDPTRGNLHMVAHKGIPARLVEAEHCLKVGECLCGEAVVKKVALVHDLRQAPAGPTLECRRAGFQTVSVFHIFAHEQNLGFFNLHFKSARQFDERERALLESMGAQLGVAIENERYFVREREMAISEERNLVARGLHDSIAQGLNFLNLQVQMMEQSLAAKRLDEACDIVPALRAGVEESYQDVRELLLNFRSRLHEGNLLASLQMTINKFRQQAGIVVELQSDGEDGPPFPGEQQLQILFIVQEALSNVRKHAGASRVLVRLHDRHDFVLSIEDDGAGFDASAVLERKDSQVGLHIMRERAARIDATLDIQSAPGEGTRVTLRLPMEMRHAA
ncbi:type IV pili methyl-accepting chemotaxis transducer N-terminal domain-containing protein [Massilia agilis]|uniref:Sensor protein n=1 Tax=Massilia agilis TaxID=1811226 RepID=A0ABT2DE74_9BURK|nr:type IV pili methyl-accepting chemotaxis transducer N-terminal domain-containing protein [Massilia agilis]MCS0809489.1 type IV pili methyl-accepting chemotaxis transducer N-terminal domain-containing protein [Massilia agilis]